MARLSSRSEFDPRTGSLLSASTALFFLVGAAFLLGGGARSDVTSLLLLRPLAVLVLAIGLLALTPTASRRFRPLWWFGGASRSEEHTSELQSLMRSSYAVFCLKK